MFDKPSLYDVEHAINMYADGYVVAAAADIYNKKKLSIYKNIIKKCHIYMIGYMPNVEFGSFEQVGREVKIKLKFAGEEYEKVQPLPDGFDLAEDETGHFVQDAKGRKLAFHQASLYPRPMEFDVKYIGQAIGKKSERDALSRLLKHETLQKISLIDRKENHSLYVLLIELIDANRNFVILSGNALDTSKTEERIEAGNKKLFETTKSERVSLFEAAFIRYFQPKYNKEFKDSFPSTDLKLLADCYEKDFQAVVAEIDIEAMEFMLRSDHVAAARRHVASFNLHEEDARRSFFFDTSFAVEPTPPSSEPA